MSNFLLKTFLIALLLAAFAHATDWPAIPPEAWAIKQPGDSNAQGAVILEEWIRFGIQDTEVHKRIRIFGEAGKGAAALPAFNHIDYLEGRTVQQDGQVIVFNHSKDMVTANLKVGRWESTVESLVPPGLSSNCIVDLYYRTGSFIRGYWIELPILESYPIRKKVIELEVTPFLSSALVGLVDIKLEKPMERTTENKIGNSIGHSKQGRYFHDVFQFKDLPAYELESYSLPTARERPRLLCFHQPLELKAAAQKGYSSYWIEACKVFFKKNYVDDLHFSKRDSWHFEGAYLGWSRELLKGLSGDSGVKASMILSRMVEQIQNSSHLTKSEWAKLSKDAVDEKIEAQDLDASIERKRTTSLGLHYLFFQLLTDAGLQPKLLFVANRVQRAFIYQLPNIYQFTDVLIGIQSTNAGMLWFDPTRRYFPVGSLSPDFQGTKGLLVDPGDWSCKPHSVEIQPSFKNQSRYDYDLTLADEDTFTARASFSGYPEYLERLKYFPLELEDQARTLKEELGARLNSFKITKAEVEHATDVGATLSWTLSGVKESDEGRLREVVPFPGLRFPLTVPDTWPATRSIPIVVPYCRQFSAVSKFRVPRGWKLGKVPEIVESNEFGSVNWQVKETLDGEDMRVEVSYAVEVKRMYADPALYSAFRSFLAWIETASRRVLTLERVA